MPTGVFNARKVRDSDGLKPKMSAFRTGETLLKRQEVPTSYNPRHGRLALRKGERRDELVSRNARIQSPMRCSHGAVSPCDRESTPNERLDTARRLQLARGLLIRQAQSSGRSRPCGRIADCFDNLLDCINHQLG